MRILFHNDSYGACAYYRAYLPSKHLRNHQIVFSDKLTNEYDAYIFHRYADPKLIKRLQNDGKKVALQVDDDLFHIPDWNPAFNQIYLQNFENCLQIVNLVICSTEPLKQIIEAKTNKEVVIAENLCDLDDWQPITPPAKDKIVWTGSLHHKEDLRLILPVVEELERWDVEMVFFGAIPDELVNYKKLPHCHLAVPVPISPRVKFVENTELLAYPKTLQALEGTIALCPLTDEKFNASKSNIKVLECTLAGMATVASESIPYSGLASISVKNGWIDAVERLITDQEYRKNCWKKTLDNVKENWSWHHSNKVENWYKAMMKLKG